MCTHEQYRDTHVHIGMGMCTPCQSAQQELTLPGNVTAMPRHGAEQAPVLLLPRHGTSVGASPCPVPTNTPVKQPWGHALAMTPVIIALPRPEGSHEPQPSRGSPAP